MIKYLRRVKLLVHKELLKSYKVLKKVNQLKKKPKFQRKLQIIEVHQKAKNENDYAKQKYN